MGNCCTRNNGYVNLQRRSHSIPSLPPIPFEEESAVQPVPSLLAKCVDQLCEAIENGECDYMEKLTLPEPIIAMVLDQMIVRQKLTLDNLLHFRNVPLQRINFHDYCTVDDDWLSILFRGDTNLETLAPGIPALNASLLQVDLSRCESIGERTIDLLSECTSITHLVLDGCRRIPSSAVARLGNLRKMQCISFQECNQLRDEAFVCLDEMKSLEYCNLRGCDRITDATVSYLADKLDLKFLRLDACSGITDDGMSDLGNLTKLQYFNAGFCFRVSHGSLGWLTQNKDMSDLNLSSMVLSMTPTGPAINSVLQSLTNLERLRIQNLCMTGTGPGIEPTAWPKSLRELDISHCDFSIRFLQDLPQLVKLDLSFGRFDVAELEQSLKHCKMLRELSLENCGANDAVMAVVCTLTELEDLNISENFVSNQGFKEIHNLSKLVSLQASFTDIGNSGLKQLGKIKTLSELQLDSQKITDDGVKHLESNTALRYLNLRGSSVSDDGIKSLAKLVHLRKLELCNGFITDAGLQRLATLPLLQDLNLSSNEGITDVGVSHLSRLPHLENLNLSYTSITRASVPVFKDFFAIRRICLFDCNDVKNSTELNDIPPTISIALSGDWDA